MPTHSERIIRLISGYLAGSLDEAERAELERWMAASELNRRAVEDFQSDDALRAADLSAIRDRIWERLDAHIPEARTRTFPVWRWVAAAAVVAAIVGVFMLRKTGPAPAAPVAKITTDVAPGGNAAILTLAGGRRITLDSAANGRLTQHVVKVSDGAIVYDAAADTQTNTLTTPVRGQYHLTLSDGTKVWLNASSSITFPAAFRHDRRTVAVTGEVYFDVAPDATRPFTVRAGDETVRVLGTAFNVNAYADEASVNTTLVDGRVQTAGGTLKPGEQSRTYADGHTDRRRVNVGAVTAWRYGNFQFDSDDLPTVMRQLARWYGVTVTYTGAVPGGTYSGEVGRNTHLSNVLKILELSGLRCKVEGNTVTVLP
ncbi:MAG TPA: FecR domain-containing protein [Dinghuibacter sp.]|uniref:FecR domain-containing protein n=1 Tax=Dinghuibacter sp. TaxID=2024697 RepID=UPI002C26E209|nr:FecR domain-containing protein [Dinghuibacter sp.]HTJ11789.1 FecR domain-containing protein [Dinghuibacter sp.]